jgi:L,D-transpeptidase YbiS
MDKHHIEISIARQELRLIRKNRDVIMSVSVSTAANGAGEKNGSECTPRGKHIICAKIGAGAPVNTVFVGRRQTGERYSPGLASLHPERDWILTRILWLKGCESGYNRGGAVDTQRRYIYIHGAPDEIAMGVPGSRGCVRMRNSDLVRLFDMIDVGTPVAITEN